MLTVASVEGKMEVEHSETERGRELAIPPS